MLKTTATLLIGWIPIVLGIAAGSGFAALSSTTSPWFMGAAALAQAEAPDRGDVAEQKRQEAAGLLRRARQSLADDDLSTAEKLVAQAEATGASYTPLYMGDTPKKARRDLELKRTSAKAAPVKPSQLLAPGSVKKAPAADPFTGRVSGSILSDPSRTAPPADTPNPIKPLKPDDPQQNPLPFGKNLNSLPEANDVAVPAALSRAVTTASAPPATQPVAGMSGSPPASPSELLRGARRALAVGDVRRATALVQQAKADPARYGPLDDTPEKVDAAIRKYQEVTSQQSNSEAYQRTYARMLIEQAEALMRSGDLAEAESLVVQAQRQQLTYGPFEAKPDDLMARIEAVRKQAGGRPPLMPGAPPPEMRTGGKPPAMRDAEAVDLARQARAALKAGQLAMAESMAREAEMMRLPDSVYAEQDRPGQILFEIRQAKQEAVAAAAPAARATAGGPGPQTDGTASHAIYQPGSDFTRNVQASAKQSEEAPAELKPPTRLPDTTAAPRMTPAAIPMPSNKPLGPGHLAAAPAASARDAGAATPPGRGMALLQQGEEALKAHETDRAYQLFRRAAAFMGELDPDVAQRLQDHLQLLSPPNLNHQAGAPTQSLTDDAAAKQTMLVRQVAADLAQKESTAKAMRGTDPNGALALLQEARAAVESSALDTAMRDQLLRRVDRNLADLQQYIEQNRPRIELQEKNEQIRADVDRTERTKVEVQEKFAQMVNEFNRLIDEQRYAEAEVVAKRAVELNPHEAVAQQMLTEAKFIRTHMHNNEVIAAKEDGFLKQLGNVDIASEGFDDNNPYQHGDVKKWQELTKSRSDLLASMGRHRSERDLEIEKKLRTPVSLQFTNAPLTNVLEYMAKLAEVNLHIDPKGLSEEGVSSDTPVTIDLRHEIMLKSALNLVLEPLHLTYIIKDEVLKITTEKMRNGEIYMQTYNVADLVMPIPNFVPSPMLGLEGGLHNAMANASLGGFGQMGGTPAAPLAVLASKDGKQSGGMINPAVLAQMAGASSSGVPAPHGKGAQGFGPGSLGGGSMADFDSLIDLIVATIAPDSWDENGGPGSIQPFETNLSIVVSQTQAVHEQIVDLLEQLRRLQDLQVTIEVRFITLNDNFFERIGVDFDFQVDDNLDFSKKLNPALTPDIDLDARKNYTVGRGPVSPDTYTADLDIPFTQNSFGLAVPQFGGFDATAGATMGFAILSDIEAFFFINAAQGDKRTNVLQAPKVTLFNGQMASIMDTSQTPFVVSVIPVVGDFAAAQQPVIVVLSEGTHMSVQAVVSNDRRFVRLTIVPFFSKIGKDVPTFQFTGSQTSTTDTSASGWVNPTDPNDNRRDTNSNTGTTTATGTSVQLPTFSFVTVSTTVSVPDGGTVLLGGIKRLSEGRNEFGVPILDKVPFINRLFKNVGIGRDTSSLMMMVTPRIIIQEEEEKKLGIETSGP